MNLNKCLLAGNLCKDPELRYTQSNTAVTKINIAVNREYKQGEEKKKEVTYLNIVAWGKTAEFISQYFTKGQAIFVEGRIATRNYDDKDGKKVYVTEVIAEQVQFVGKKEIKEYDQPEENNNSMDENIPF